MGQVEASYSQAGTQLDFPKEAATVQSHPIKSPEQSALQPLPSVAVPSSQASTSAATVDLVASTTIPSPQIVVQTEVAPALLHVHPGST